MHRQRRRIVAKAENGAIDAEEAVFPLKGLNTGAGGHKIDLLSFGHDESARSCGHFHLLPDALSPPHPFGIDDKLLANAIPANRFKFFMIDQHHQHIGARQRLAQRRQSAQSVELFRQLMNIWLNDQGFAAVPAGDLGGNGPWPGFRAGHQYSA